MMKRDGKWITLIRSRVDFYLRYYILHIKKEEYTLNIKIHAHISIGLHPLTSIWIQQPVSLNFYSQVRSHTIINPSTLSMEPGSGCGSLLFLSVSSGWGRSSRGV